MSVIIVVSVITIAIIIYFIQGESHKNSINTKVEELGGKVVSIERTVFNNGPFFIKGKGKSIYKFEYIMEGERKEGWVTFGSLFGPDWRL